MWSPPSEAGTTSGPNSDPNTRTARHRAHPFRHKHGFIHGCTNIQVEPCILPFPTSGRIVGAYPCGRPLGGMINHRPKFRSEYPNRPTSCTSIPAQTRVYSRLYKHPGRTIHFAIPRIQGATTRVRPYVCPLCRNNLMPRFQPGLFATVYTSESNLAFCHFPHPGGDHNGAPLRFFTHLCLLSCILTFRAKPTQTSTLKPPNAKLSRCPGLIFFRLRTCRSRSSIP